QHAKYPPSSTPAQAHHQQIRTTQQQHQPSAPQSHPRSPPKPRSQLEAMPPHLSPLSLQARMPSSPVTQHYNASIRHPVFFTERLRKAPFPLPIAARGSMSPVAEGYILEDRRKDAAAPNGRTKL
ncbi:hypothetical protein BJ546DRAFT_866359, partial [Cryomyces antarcticus]